MRNKITVFGSTKWRMTIAGALICMVALLVLPPFPLMTNGMIFNAFFGGLLLGLGATLTLLAATNAKDIRDNSTEGTQNND